MEVPAGQPRTRRIRIPAGVATVAVILAIYLGLLLIGYLWLGRSAPALQPESIENASETVILLEPSTMHAIEDKVDTEVLVIPHREFMDTRFGVLNTDMTVRLFPSTELGELDYPAGSLPELVTTSLWALGDMNTYPFDTYTTARISAEVIVGTGDSRRYVPARVEVVGALYGWELSYDRAESGGGVVITFSRSRVTVALTLGLCLVLLALPPLALYVAIKTARGAKKFQPPMITWFAVMLFAVVPIREVFPGDPPTGIWLDETVVLWVLISLVAAMVIFVAGWARHAE